MTPADRHGSTHPVFGEESLRDALTEFGSIDVEHRIIVWQAYDFIDSGQAGADHGVPLTDDGIMRNMYNAPGGDPAMCWNWRPGALEAAYGGYREFQIRHILKAWASSLTRITALSVVTLTAVQRCVVAISRSAAISHSYLSSLRGRIPSNGLHF